MSAHDRRSYRVDGGQPAAGALARCGDLVAADERDRDERDRGDDDDERDREGEQRLT
jgi:hypothetical protein